MAYKTETTLLKSIMDVVGFILLCVVFIVQSVIKWFIPSSYKSRKDLEGEIVLVTGGGGGLGRLLAMRVARLKAVVVVWDINYKAVEETMKLVEGIGGTVYGYQCNLADREDVYKVAEKTRNEAGDVTILINNAGVVSGRLLLDTPDHLIQRTFEVNTMALFWTAKAFLPKMVENNHGHIVTIASMAGFVGISKLVDYCSSKHAAVGFDEALRVELETLGAKGVKTTAICPYFIQSTGMFHDVNCRFLPNLKSNEVADRVIQATLKEEHVVMIPAGFHVGIVLKQMFPWACVSMFLRGLVPDAAPYTPSAIASKNNVSVSPNSIYEKLGNGSIPNDTGLNHRMSVGERNP